MKGERNFLPMFYQAKEFYWNVNYCGLHCKFFSHNYPYSRSSDGILRKNWT